MINPYENIKFSSMAGEILHYFKNIDNKRILEIGSDAEGEMLTCLTDRYHPAEMVGLNPKVKSHELSENSRLLEGDIRCTDFPDNYFDFVFSLAAFEHIFNLDKAMSEIHRILKPGGLLYSKFGPIWSSCWGHHLWVNHDNSLYNYINTILPPYCHLLMSPGELMAFLTDKFPTETREKIVSYVYESPDQNRLFYEDYESIVNSTPFQNLIFYGSTNYPLSEQQRPESYVSMLDSLQKKYPGYKKFYFQVIYLLLRK
jgi:ubiquinone/menaquinone biosynthesis C-methylase UbiE